MNGRENPGPSFGKQHGARSAPPNPHRPVIGRAVLNSETFGPALAYLREHVTTMTEYAPFSPLITEKHMRRAGRSDAQHILGTFCTSMGVEPGPLGPPLPCRITGLTTRTSHHRATLYRPVRLHIQEVDSPGQLAEERAALLNHMGLEVEWPKIPKTDKSFGIVLALISQPDRDMQTLRQGILPLLPEKITLGPIQLRPAPPPMQGTQ